MCRGVQRFSRPPPGRIQVSRAGGEDIVRDVMQNARVPRERAYTHENRAAGNGQRTAVYVIVALVAMLFVASPLSARVATGSLRGHVADEAGRPLAKSIVMAKDEATGLARWTRCEPDGRWIFPALPAGAYTVSALLGGYGIVAVPDVRVPLAGVREIDFQLVATDVEEQITMTVDEPIQLDRRSIGTRLDRGTSDALPAGLRDFAYVSALAPAAASVVDEGPLSGGGRGLELNRGTGGAESIVADGASDSGALPAGLASYSIDAIEELRLELQPFDASSGPSAHGVLSVVTRGGSNDASGSVSALLRDSSLSESTRSESRGRAEGKGHESWRSSLALGGPIVRDRAHFFLAYDEASRESLHVVDSGGIDPSLDGSSEVVSARDRIVTVKLTATNTASQFATVRYVGQRSDDEEGASPLAAPESLAGVRVARDSLVVGHLWQFSPRATNEVSVQFVDFGSSASSPTNAPALVWPGGFRQGRSVIASQTLRARTLQIDEVVSWAAVVAGSHHDLRAGISWADTPTQRASIATGRAGTFAMLDDVAGSAVRQITYTSGGGEISLPAAQFGIFVHDDWSVGERLSLHAGIRWDRASGLDLDQRANPIWQELATQTAFDEEYLRGFRGGRGGVLGNDGDNWGPRFGFEYDLSAGGAALVRGGWGVFHDPGRATSTVLYPALAARGVWGTSYSSYDPDGIRNPDGSLFQPGDPLPPSELPPGPHPPGPVSLVPSDVASPTIATMKATRASLGYAAEFEGLVGVSIDATTIRYRDVPYRFEANPRLDARGAAQPARRFSKFGDFRLWMGDGEVDYDALDVAVRARLTGKIDLRLFYTLSRAEGNVLSGAGGERLFDSASQPDLLTSPDASVDALDPRCARCYGPLNSDARHRVTLTASYHSPRDVSVSGVIRYRSALPYTRLASEDLDGDGYLSDLAPGAEHVNDARGSNFSQVDVRISKRFSMDEDLGIELVGEIYNLFDAGNPARFDGSGNPHAYAGDPLEGEQRLVQLGARVTF